MENEVHEHEKIGITGTDEEYKKLIKQGKLSPKCSYYWHDELGWVPTAFDAGSIHVTDIDEDGKPISFECYDANGNKIEDGDEPF